MNQRFETLWQDYLEGELDPTGMAELDQLMSEDPELLERAVHLYEQHRLLGFEMQAFSADRFTEEVLAKVQSDQNSFVSNVTQSLASTSVPSQPMPASSWRKLSGYAAVAFVTLFLSLVAQWTLFQNGDGQEMSSNAAGPPPPVEYVATLVRGENCRLGPSSSDATSDDQSLRPGDRLTPGLMALDQGMAIVQFDDGASVVLTGQTRLEVVSPGSAILRAGHVTVRAPEEAAGFMLQTPSSDVIDLGTEFSVAVDGEGNTELHVTEGEIEWHPKDNQRNSGTILSEGNAIRVEKTGDGTATKIPLSARRFAELTKAQTPRNRLGRLLAFESFDYPMESSVSQDAEAKGGLGWASHWYRGWPTSTQVLDFEPGHNLEGPPGLAKSTGGCLEFPTEKSRMKNFREASKRRLAEPIDLGSDSVRYLSVLIHRRPETIGTDDEWFRFMLVAGENRKQRLGFGVLSDRRPILFSLEGNTTSPKVIAEDQTYLFVAKIVCGKNRPDQAFLKVYGPNEAIDATEPFEWTIAGRMIDHQESMDEFHLYNGPDRAYWADEIRLGTTWESVTPIAD